MRVALILGDSEGNSVGKAVGCCVGCKLSNVVGISVVCFEGLRLGDEEISELGAVDGFPECVGCPECDGSPEGCVDGLSVGFDVGDKEGDPVGVSVR